MPMEILLGRSISDEVISGVGNSNNGLMKMTCVHVISGVGNSNNGLMKMTCVKLLCPPL